MKKALIIIVIAIAVIAGGIVLFIKGNTASPGISGGQPAITNDLSKAPGDQELLGNLKTAGLDALTAEGTVLHIHQHLDIIINGQAVPVPAEIGIGSSFISPIHTHDTSGVLHVESPVVKDFKLSQFFQEWGVDFNNNCIGTNCADATHKLVVGVNGSPVSDVTNIVLKAHDEIEVWYGNKTDSPTFIKNYNFPTGL